MYALDGRHLANTMDQFVRQQKSGGSTLDREGGGTRLPKSWLGPQISRTLDTLWSIDSQQN